jgi:GxxExxY protein
MDRENAISYDIRAAAYKVYKILGPGLLESVYEEALLFELQRMDHRVESQVGFPVIYEEIEMEVGFRV